MEIWFSLIGDINRERVQETVNFINGQLYSSSPIHLQFMIASNGGDLDSAFQLYDYLKSLPIKVTTIGFSNIDSAAIIVFLAGESRLSTKKCRYRFHLSKYNVANPKGLLAQHEQSLDFFKDLNRRYLDILIEETKKERRQLKKLQEKGSILNAPEAQKLGLVTEIIEKLPLKRQLAEKANTGESIK